MKILTIKSQAVLLYVGHSASGRTGRKKSTKTKQIYGIALSSVVAQERNKNGSAVLEHEVFSRAIEKY